MSVSRRALLTFAFVSEALKSHRDIVVGLAPLFNPIASELSGQIFSADQLRNELAQRYGLSITTDIADFVAFSLHRAGLLKRREVGSNDVTFLWTARPHPTTNIPTNFDQKIERLAKAALEFASTNPSLLTWTMSEDDSLNMLFDWIIDSDKQLSEAELLHNQSSDGTLELPKKKLRSEQQYFCSRFTQWLRKKDIELFDVLSDVGNAVMISEVIMELRTPTFTPSRQGNLYIYLDAPLCMELLGCSGKARKEDTSYLVSRLREFGASILIFSHSVDELRENLNAVLKNQPGRRRGPTATALLRQEVPEDYLWGVLRNTEQYLRDANIEIYDVARTPLPVSYGQAFPDSSENALLSRLQQNYNRLEAAERDAHSVAIVMRRRNRHRSSDLFRVKHIMITRNPMVSALSKKYCEDIGLIEDNQFGPTIQARQAAALVWFAVGSDQKQELSRRQLILSCSRAVESTPGVIEQLRKKLKEIKPENVETFDALVREPRNLQVAMDFAQGSETKAIQSDPDALLQKLTETLTIEEREKYRAELSRVKDRHSAELAIKAAAEQKLREEVAALRFAESRRQEQQLTAIEMTFYEFARQCRRAIVASRFAFAVFVFGVAFLTSSILLDRLDKAWVEGWTLGLSLIAGTLVAVPVFADPIKLIERGVRSFFARRFRSEINRKNLTELAGSVKIDWTTYSIFLPQLKNNDDLF